MMATGRLLMVLLLLDICAGCQFPGYLQSMGISDRHWMYHVHNQGERGLEINMYMVTFNNDLMDVREHVNEPTTATAIRPYRRQCVDSLSAGYIVSHEYSDVTETDAAGVTVVRYICVQFKQKSPYVVVVSEGDLSDEYSAELCMDVLTDDWWPMISYQVENVRESQHVPSSFVGGYHFSMMDAQTGDHVCLKDTLNPSRVEVSCDPDKDVTFSFGDDCSSSELKMGRQESVYVIAEWSSSGHTFMVIKKAKSLNLWCLRIPDDGELSNFTAQLFLDIVCDPRVSLPPDARYMNLSMERVVYTSLCQDISSQCANSSDMCNSADSAARTVCMDTCDACNVQALRIPDINSSCTFNDSLQGAWIGASQTVKNEVLITPSNVYLFDVKPFRCMSTSHNLTSRFPLLHLADDGCMPRFTCIEFTVESPGYIRYRLGWTAYWPRDAISVQDPYDMVCQNEKFSGWHNQVTDEYKEPVTHSLVHDQRSPGFQERTADCHLGNVNSTVVSFRRLSGSQGGDCQGVLAVSCDQTSTITAQNSDCTTWPREGDTYHCMSSILLSDNRRLVVTVSNDSRYSTLDDMDFQCWMFSANLNSLYVLPWADCEEKTFDQIIARDMYRDEKDTFVIDVMDKFSSTCGEEPSTTQRSDLVVITVYLEADTTTYTFVDFVGSSQSMKSGVLNVAICVMYSLLIY